MLSHDLDLLRQVVRLDFYGEGNLLGNATGFLVKTRKFSCLVSCQHSFTNWDHVNRRWIGPAQRPDEVGVWFLTDENPPRWMKCYFKLFERAEPSYFSHPRSPLVDLTAFPIHMPEDCITKLVPLVALSGDLTIQIGDSLCVPGFLHGLDSSPELRGFGGHPVCKTAHVATGFSTMRGGLPLALIDGTCRSGMSGAPVFLKASGGWIFCGTYCAQNEDAELGEIATAAALSETLSAAKQRQAATRAHRSRQGMFKNYLADSSLG